MRLFLKKFVRFVVVVHGYMMFKKGIFFLSIFLFHDFISCLCVYMYVCVCVSFVLVVIVALFYCSKLTKQPRGIYMIEQFYV